MLSDYFRFWPFSNEDVHEKAIAYPQKENRYLSFGWNQAYQYCYTDNDLTLLNHIYNRFKALDDADNLKHFFSLITEKKYYDWWTCHQPHLDLLSTQITFTLPNREAKDLTTYPLWNFADSMARQIANWQGERIKNQNIHLMNDPVMIVFEELKNWFFHTLVEKNCREEDLQVITKRQHYVKNLLYIIPDFGLDRLHLHEIQHQLGEAAKILNNCRANKKLPELLSDVIIKSKSLENTIGTYLHFLFINEEVADNFSQDFTGTKVRNCHLSPVCKAYQSAKASSIHVNLPAIASINPFYNIIQNSETHMQLELKSSAINSIKFANFMTPHDKTNYLAILAGFASLTHIRKTLEDFKNIQSSIGTYIFASHYLAVTNELTHHYLNLIDTIKLQTGQLLDSVNDGFKHVLEYRTSNREHDYFEKNLRALETLFAKDITTQKQINDFCELAKISMLSYQSEMKKLSISMQSGVAMQEIDHAMQKLVIQIHHINSFISAQLNKTPIEIKPNAHVDIMTAPFTRDNQLTNNLACDDGKINDLYMLMNKNLDPITQQPIYTYHFFQDQLEVGSIQLYGQETICFSADQIENNILKSTGIMREDNITKSFFSQKTCTNFPPTMHEKIYFAMKEAALHGFFRGSSTLINRALKQKGVSNIKAQCISQASYYSALFSFYYYSHFFSQKNKDAAIENEFSALYEALFATGNICLANITLGAINTLLVKASNFFETKHTFISKGINYCNSLLRFGIFAHQAKSNGLAATTSAILSGSIVQEALQKSGDYILK